MLETLDTKVRLYSLHLSLSSPSLSLSLSFSLSLLHTHLCRHLTIQRPLTALLKIKLYSFKIDICIVTAKLRITNVTYNMVRPPVRRNNSRALSVYFRPYKSANHVLFHLKHDIQYRPLLLQSNSLGIWG